MKTSVASAWVGSAVVLLLLGAVAAPASAQPVPVTACGTLAGQASYRLDADLAVSTGTCITLVGNGISFNMNGHSIRGFTGATAGITGSGGNNITITGPGIVHDFDVCIIVTGNHNKVEDVLAYNCQSFGIALGNFSKCVQCRVHDVRRSEPPNGIGIFQGLGCLLESSIVETSDDGALVGEDCKVWDLVVDVVGGKGLTVGAGTTVARTVISHYHDGPGLDYTRCGGIVGAAGALTAKGCQDSSNSVTLSTGGGISILDAPAATGFGPSLVTTDCATNGLANGVGGGTKYVGSVGGCSP